MIIHSWALSEVMDMGNNFSVHSQVRTLVKPLILRE